MDGMTVKIPWDGWELIEQIGRGEFGTVYKISCTKFNVTEYAAMKVISIPSDPQMIEADYSCGYDKASVAAKYKSYLDLVLNEYQLMMKIKSCPNVVRCDDICVFQHEDEIGWDVYIRMEHLTPAIQILPIRINEESIIKLGLDMCSALDACENAGILHRDIKPSNILVSEQGSYKLGDFGVSRTLEDEDTYGTKGIGTYNYMAPEVYNGGKYGKSADIYSLGMVMYWLLNHRTFPFLSKGKAPTAQEVVAARQRRFNGESLPRPSYGSDELVAVVLKACSFDPAERYNNAKELMKDLINISYGSSSGPDPEIASIIGTIAAEKDDTPVNTEIQNSKTETPNAMNEFPKTDHTEADPFGNSTVSIENTDRNDPAAVPAVEQPAESGTKKTSKIYIMAGVYILGLLAVVGICFAVWKNANKGNDVPETTTVSTSATTASTTTTKASETTTTTTTVETTTTEPNPTIVLGLPESLFSYDGEYLEVDSALFRTSYSRLDELTRNRLANLRDWSESDSDADSVCDLGEFAFKFKDDICVSFVCIYPNRGLTLDDISDLYLEHVGDYDDVTYDKNGNLKSCEWITKDNVRIHIWWDKSANCCFAEYEPAE